MGTCMANGDNGNWYALKWHSKELKGEYDHQDDKGKPRGKVDLEKEG